ncbi:MAG: hypothetical protein FJZ00_12925, partial [Candidatus Sericytochromatia bacterium]|nr:hypothetical protein [Candidatus Tanganyikabacteria bacterium]
PDHPPIDGRVLAHVAAAAAAGAEERPIWQLESAPAPADPPGEAAELAAIGLACHLITHHGGYLAFTYVEDNGLIHEACLAPADDPAGIVAGLLAQPEVVPLLRRDARARLADSRFHDAVRTYAHDLGAEVATRDWLRMPVSVHQRLLAERGLAVAAELPASSDGRTAGGDGDPLAVAPPVHDVPWDAGVVLPGLGAA